MCIPILKFIDFALFEIFDHKMLIFGPVARQPVLPWQPFGSPHVEVRPYVSLRV